MFKMIEPDAGLLHNIIDVMCMVPKDYGLDCVLDEGGCVATKHFFECYRIFRVENTHSSCYHYFEITSEDVVNAPTQDILIARVDEIPGAVNELLLQYQISSLDVQRHASNGSEVQGGTHRSAVHMLLSKLAVQI